jgi:hypothetical protein
MNLGNMARKVAGVFVELPEEAEKETETGEARAENQAAGAAAAPIIPLAVPSSGSGTAPSTDHSSAANPAPPAAESHPAPTETPEQLLREMGLSGDVGDETIPLPVSGTNPASSGAPNPPETPVSGPSSSPDQNAAAPGPAPSLSGGEGQPVSPVSAPPVSSASAPDHSTPPDPSPGRPESKMSPPVIPDPVPNRQEATPPPSFTPINSLDPPTPVSQPAAPVGATDVASIYRAARITPPPFTAEEMLELLASLPSELPLAVRRQTMTVTLNAISKNTGATPSSIASDASAKIAALTSYVDNQAGQIARQTADADRRIAGLQAQIEEIRRSTETALQAQAQTGQMCAEERERLASVLAFFGYDEPQQSKPASKKAAASAPPAAENPPDPAPVEQSPEVQAPEEKATAEPEPEEKPLW